MPRIIAECLKCGTPYDGDNAVEEAKNCEQAPDPPGFPIGSVFEERTTLHTSETRYIRVATRKLTLCGDRHAWLYFLDDAATGRELPYHYNDVQIDVMLRAGQLGTDAVREAPVSELASKTQ